MARKPKVSIAPEPLPMPPPTDREIELNRQLLEKMQRVTEQLTQRNLDNAVLLAQQAARRRGPLVDHFCELGRPFGDSLDAPEKPTLRVVKGGGA